ncbi:MAG: DUF799 family lipoprotein [Muribaculaceae bacterium]|nr:DUF799 family lipoprotein [Muribaculaceae bacterium]
MKKYLFILSAVTMMCLCSCSKSITRASLYPKMYEEKPVTILVMPPINNSNNAGAKEYFYSSLAQPLNEKGYYVISPFLSMDLLKQESAYDSELFINGSLDAFRKVFDVDAVLFTTINKWEKQSALSYINVGITYTLKSAKTGEVLFEREGDLKVSFASSGGGLLGMALDILQTATTDHVVAARKCNYFILQDLPEGKYGLDFLKDGSKGVGQQKVKATVGG